MARVLLLGDSIRLNLQKQVREILTGEAEVSGPAENCASSRDLLRGLEQWLGESAADVVHVNCGLHDIRHDPGNGGPQVPAEEYARNVAEIIETIVLRGNPTVIWSTTTPVNDERHNSRKDSRRFQQDVSRYNDVAMRIAVEAGARINDLHSMVIDAGADGLWAEDGVHFTESGYRLLAAGVASAVREALGLTPPLPHHVRNAGFWFDGRPWRLANSLVVLRAQIDRAAPGRNRATDGDVGDADHSMRESDHNPTVRSGETGVVTALDITHDPDEGCDAALLAESLRRSQDPRISFLIHDRRIVSCEAREEFAKWEWRPYQGANPHTTHLHVSVRHEPSKFDDSSPWQITWSE